ncbi:DnaJ domain-containing protein [Methanoplanus endosymbiosus]|uniref:DnaJ domain-containing protein n=1 Tax=Methanoplanus endosymbiosus TaxID=33865 RepID=A0A9E7PRB7_9EURY|nr:DnaJ domain-containing protein [Methanoplanus endosymbiosus]UUX93639.1 DnaJ domain-containing protein [Methanoplanus endosymbiosus]
MAQNYYEILGVPSGSSQKEIMSAYRSLAKAFHPDISTHPNAELLFLKITEAYGVLSEPEMRRDYDHSLRLNGGDSGEDACDYGAGGGRRFSGEDYGDESSYDRGGTKGGKDEYSLMADYEYYSEKPEKFLIDGEEIEMSRARHIITGDHDYIVYNDRLIDTGGILRFTHEGTERFMIDGAETVVTDAEHYIQGGSEYVVIDGESYLIREM